jgi:hypothetical protein
MDPDATLRQRTPTPELRRHGAVKQQRRNKPPTIVGAAVPESSFRPLPAYAALVKQMPVPAYGALIKPTPVPAVARPVSVVILIVVVHGFLCLALI